MHLPKGIGEMLYEVVAVAMQLKNGLDLEIWDHKRFVVRLTVRTPPGARRPSK